MQIPKGLYFHPMLVHFPQALFPTAFAIFLLHAVTGRGELDAAARVAAGVGTLATPVTIVTGFLDWKFRYQAYMTSVFKIKIVGSFVLLGLGAGATAVRFLVPEAALFPLAGAGWLYAGLLGACALDCVILGHYGGKLVFH